MFHRFCRCFSFRRRRSAAEEESALESVDVVDTMNQEYAVLVQEVFVRPPPAGSKNRHYDAETHTRIKSLRQSIGEELERRLSVPDPDSKAEEKRRSWRFQSIDSEYRLQLFHGYIDDAVKVEPALLRDPSVQRLLSLDIIG
jgi:hypothetical protein